MLVLHERLVDTATPEHGVHQGDVQLLIEGVDFKRLAADVDDVLEALATFQLVDVSVDELQILAVQLDVERRRPALLIVALREQIAAVQADCAVIQRKILVLHVLLLHEQGVCALELVEVHVDAQLCIEAVGAALGDDAGAQGAAVLGQNGAQAADERFERALRIAARLARPEHLVKLLIGHRHALLQDQVLQQAQALFRFAELRDKVHAVHQDGEPTEHADLNLLFH